MSELTHKVPGLLKEFVDGVRKAEGAAQQMVHQHEGDPQWIALYQRLTAIKERTIKIAMRANGVKVQHGPRPIH